MKTPKLVMTLLARDERDIIEKNIEFHLNHGVDFIIATDNASTDNTRDIFVKYQKKGKLYLINEPGRDISQSKWNNRMAEIAINNYKADIIFHCDADEFWFPKSGDLKTEIWNSPADVLTVNLINILLEDKDGVESFPEDTKYAVTNPIRTDNWREDSKKENFYFYKYPPKVIFKTHKGLLKVSYGNHAIVEQKSNIINKPSKNINIYHFPLRNKKIFYKKVTNYGKSLDKNNSFSKDSSWHIRRWFDSYKSGKLDEEYKKLIITKEEALKMQRTGVIKEFNFKEFIEGIMQLKKELSFGQYGRYAIIRDIINNNRTENKKFKILDVGGRGNLMKKFLPEDNVYYLDPFIDSEDNNFIKGDGCAMQLKDKSFDWVVSADVFEHVPEEKRIDFLEENIRVAKLGTILVAPFFSKEVQQAEINANENYKILSEGKDHMWLREHIENGLPDKKILEDYLNSRSYSFQKLHNNQLFLWELLLGISFYIQQNLDEQIKSEFEDFNYFYNTNIFPLDGLEPSYRKIYFIKKDKGLKNLNIKIKPISNTLFLKAIKKSLDIINKISIKNKSFVRQKYNQIKQKDNQIKQKDNQIKQLNDRLNRLEKLGNTFLGKINWAVHNPKKFLKKYFIYKVPKSLQKKIFSSFKKINWVIRNPIKFIKKYFFKVKNLSSEFYFNTRKEGIKNALIRTINYIKYGKGFIGVEKAQKEKYSNKNIENKFSKRQAKEEVQKLIFEMEHKKITLPNEKPLVSIIVLNRNGLGYLKTMLNSIKENTIYPKYELIIVDNESTDGSVKYIKENEFNLPIKLIKNSKNVSFSYGCNQGAKLAKGNLLVFMNNDIQPIKGWLANLVRCYLSDKNIGSVGAKLIYPEKKKFKFSNRLQHVGIKFKYDKNFKFFRPYNFGNGESVLDYNKNKDYSALTAALLLVPKDKFDEVGGFDEKYFYGYEDVDLGLKLYKRGYRNVYCAKSCAFHYEFASQKKINVEILSKTKKNNIKIIKEKWHNFLTEEIFRDKFVGNKFFTENNLVVSLIVIETGKKARAGDYFTAKELGGALKEKFGWEIRYQAIREGSSCYEISEDVDILISFIDSYDINKININSPKLIKIACLSNQIDRWTSRLCLEEFDLVLIFDKTIPQYLLKKNKLKPFIFNKNLASSVKATRLLQIIRDKYLPPKIAIKVPIPNWQEAKNWGDYHFALALKKNFERQGWKTIIQIIPEWNNNKDIDCKAVLVLRGLTKYKTKSYHFNIMWNISHPDKVNIDEYDEYDYVFIASNTWAEKIKKVAKKTKVEAMLQCTDTEIFKIPKLKLDNKYKNKILFVGNSRNTYRKVVKYAIEECCDISIYGSRWKNLIDSKLIKGEYIPNNELYKYYNYANVLLNDHWGDMANKGFVSNRIFDALASGAVLLTDSVNGMDEKIKNYIVVYKDRKDFSEKLNNILKNNSKYKEKVLEAQELIENNYSFKSRADRIISAINKETKTI